RTRKARACDAPGYAPFRSCCWAIRVAMTPPTHASSSSCVPVFTYVKSARFAFSRSGTSRDSRSSVHPPRLAQLPGRGDDDDLVEPRLRPDLVEKRHLGHAHLGRFRQRG